MKFVYCFLLCVSLGAMAKEKSGLADNGHPHDMQTLEIGDKAPDFDLPGIDGKNHSLASFKEAEVLMILFTSNHCPTSHGIEKRLQAFYQDMQGKSFALVAINPNHPDGLHIGELAYSQFHDSFEDMKPYAEKNHWTFPYLYDGDEQKMARAYGCLATPHVFIFDKERRLRYKGRFDNSRYYDPETVSREDASLAVKSILAGKEVELPETRPMGCSTKWREKRVRHRRTEAAWKQYPVSLGEMKGVEFGDFIKKSKHYRLVHFWATWCAPCVQEFPEIVSLSRQFDSRALDVLTFSFDKLEDRKKVVGFLEQSGAGLSPKSAKRIAKENRKTNHYIFAEADSDAINKLLGDTWKGPLPYTALLSPEGDLLWHCNGPTTLETIRNEVLKYLKPYYSK